MGPVQTQVSPDVRAGNAWNLETARRRTDSTMSHLFLQGVHLSPKQVEGYPLTGYRSPNIPGQAHGKAILPIKKQTFGNGCSPIVCTTQHVRSFWRHDMIEVPSRKKNRCSPFASEQRVPIGACTVGGCQVAWGNVKFPEPFSPG